MEEKIRYIPPEYHSEIGHPDLEGLPTIRDITNWTRTDEAVTKICLDCGIVNACTSNICVQCGVVLDEKPGRKWTPGLPDAYTG